MTPVSEALVSEERLREIIAGCEGVQGGPWKLDKFACYVWAPAEKGGDFPLMDKLGEHGRVAELRGWGYYTGHGRRALGLSPDDAKARQRVTGEHVARLDPATVRAICTELLSRRSAPALSQDEGAGVGVIAAIEAERLRHFCSGADCEPFDHGRDEGFDLAKKAAIAALSMRKPSEAEVEAGPAVSLPVEREGWVLVPREPTREMITAVRTTGGMQAAAYAIAGWRTMIDAAPTPPQQELK